MFAGFRTYSGAGGKPIAEKSAKTGTTGTTMAWLFTNLEGTVDVQTIANTGVTTRMLRDPYGVPTASTGVWGSGTGYMNKPATASTGVDDLIAQARSGAGAQRFLNLGKSSWNHHYAGRNQRKVAVRKSPCSRLAVVVSR